MRRLTVSRRVLGGVVCGLLAMPVMMVLGSRGADVAQMEALRAANENLRVENESYREATGELTVQIASLQTALTQLGEQAHLDPATKRAMDRLPAVIRSRAVGGGSDAAAGLSAMTAGTPDSTFSILRGILGSLEAGLASVKSRIDNEHAFARSVPSTWPVIGWLSSSFGSRKDPFTGQADFHPGLDISANHGTPVRATADGTVELAARNGNYGNAVVVGHGFGIATRFGHLSRFAVRAGQKVKRGEVIGYVGATGRATSSHLHYEILVNGQPINPLRLLTRP